MIIESAAASQAARSRVTVGFVFVALLACIPAANYFVHNVGNFNGGGAPRTLDFASISAPSGVVFAGISFTLRDVLQASAGRNVVFLAILAGAVVSAVISPTLALASAVAFGVAELVDMGVFSWVVKAHALSAVIYSNVAAAALDSVLFVGIAFGTGAISSFAPGQFVVKAAASLIVGVPASFYIRSRLEKADAPAGLLRRRSRQRAQPAGAGDA